MSINVKEILANSLIVLVEEMRLEEITIQTLLRHSGVSRQTFYNHFKDKNDLIQYIYLTRIIPDFKEENEYLDFNVSLQSTLERMKTYHRFMKQACLMEGQNCLKDYIYEHCQNFDLAYHQKYYGCHPMPDNLIFATKYHATASSSMALSWILSDMPVDNEELAMLITQMRAIGMAKLFAGGERNPYQK